MPETGPRQLTRWKIGNYHFDANNNRLVGEGRDTLLEPKPAALLAYFCQHPGRNIGRDELLSAVWHGQIVSDNSISRAIVLLRKALQDDDKTRKYIATIPKLGYRFIAEVSGIERPDSNRHGADRKPGVAAPFWRNLAIGAIIAGTAFTLLLRQPNQNPSEQPNRSVVPLSRLAITQSNGHLANDGQSLVYTASSAGWDTIYWREDPSADPIPISATGGHANFATWSHDGNFVVYQFMEGNRCEFHRIHRDRFEARAAEVVYQCRPGSYSELSLSPDNSTLYFLERATAHSPYAVYSLTLDQQTKQRLSQPMSQGYGNHYVDVHPSTGAVLLLSDHTPGKTSVYELDPSTNSYELRRSFDYGLDSAIWSHRDGYIVHPSRHPSYQLVESSLADDASRVIVSDSRRISGPRRIRGTSEPAQDYLFTSYLFNRDIEVVGLNDPSLNSAVMDYLPALSHSGNLLAFVSKRSGESQIWIKHLTDGTLTSVGAPDAGRRFHDLRWSDDDRRILANTNTGILVYSLGERAYLHDITLSLPAYAVRWHDPQTLSFSHFEGERWRAYLWDLDDGQAVPLDERWAFSLRSQRQQLFLDQTLAVFRDGQELTSLAQCAPPIWRYQLRFQLDGEQLYCHAADARSDLIRFDGEMNGSRLSDAVNRFEFYSVRNGSLAKTDVASAYSDIMRTRTLSAAR